MTKLISKECTKITQANCDSILAIPKFDNNAKIELSMKFLEELRNNAFSGTEEEDVVDHIGKVLEMLDLIKFPNVDTNRLSVHVFPLSLTSATREDPSQCCTNTYASVIGSIMYAMVCTRPDIAHAVSVVSRYMDCPGKTHWEAVQ
nr:retrovirus-related Pol polyprotein from transposon TNT 1-94 [Tanacetum cinerariifolium]